MSDHDLPRTDGGAVDWERAFEDPDNGFIPLIQRAETAAVLRERALEVIERLHARKDDPQEVENFVAQLDQLIPDTSGSDDTLPHVETAVVSLLRQMKAHRIRAAREQAMHRREARRAQRRRADIEAAESRRTRRLIIAGSTVVGTAIAAIVAYEIVSQPARPDDKIADAMLDQMRQAAKSGTSTGAARVGTMGDRQAITVSGLSQESCFDTAWGLVNQGTILINGLGSPRLSPTIIRELCSQAGDRASVTWMPK